MYYLFICCASFVIQVNLNFHSNYSQNKPVERANVVKYPSVLKFYKYNEYKNTNRLDMRRNISGSAKSTNLLFSKEARLMI